MTLDGFLTVLALLAAIYAVLPPVQRLRLELAWRMQGLLGTAAIAAILGIELYDVRPPVCPAWLGSKACNWLILPDGDAGASGKLAFLVAFAWLALSIVIHRRWRPSLGSVPAVTRLAVELIDEEQFGDALKLLEPRMALLAKASRRCCWQQRVHDWLEEFGPTNPNSFARFIRGPGERRFTGETWPGWAARPVRWLARGMPDHRRAETAASDMLQILFNSPKLLDYIAERRPYFGIALIGCQTYGSADFCERYLSRLLATPGSALYHEIETNLVSEGLAFALPERNRLLRFLFADAQRAEQLSAWNGVGRYVERVLDGEERPGYWTWLNGDQGWFEQEQFRDPVYVALLFFDIMVRSAAEQAVLGHMWLYFLRHFARRLEAGYDSTGEGIDRDAEFPVRAARLIYELTQIVTGWVELFRELPKDSIHRKFPERRESPGSIPFAAALTLADVLRTVATSDRIDRGVALTLNTVILRAVRSFHDDGADLSRMRAWLIDALLSRGDAAGRDDYHNRLADLIEDTDDMLRYDVEDFVAALRARLT